MSHLPVDLELAETFTYLWNERLAHLPAAERLPEVMAVIRRAVADDSGRLLRSAAGLGIVGDTRWNDATALKSVFERMAIALGYSYEGIVSDDRHKPVSLARHKIVWGVHRGLGVTKALIAFALGGRDHVCAINSVRIVDRLVAADPALGQALIALACGDELALRRLTKAA